MLPPWTNQSARIPRWAVEGEDGWMMDVRAGEGGERKIQRPNDTTTTTKNKRLQQKKPTTKTIVATSYLGLHYRFQSPFEQQTTSTWLIFSPSL